MADTCAKEPCRNKVVEAYAPYCQVHGAYIRPIDKEITMPDNATPIRPNVWPYDPPSPDAGKVDYDFVFGDSDTTAIGTQVLAVGDEDEVHLNVTTFTADAVRIFVDGLELVEPTATADEPDLDTIERTRWRGQRLIDLGADAAEEDNDRYKGHLTQASDVLADLLGWAHQHDIPSDVLFDKAYTAHVEELKDFGLEPVE